jgi:pimeloyl-ACP methyl ester carboxylesterase
MKLLAQSLVIFMLFAMLNAISPAQEATDEPPSDTVVLVPHTDESYGIESVVPDTWTDVGNGIFARQNAPTDPTLIAQQSAPLNAESVLNAILPQLGLTEAPESVGTYQGVVLEWTLYQIDVAAGAVNVAVDLALAEADGTTYVVLLQTSPDDYEELHISVFLLTLNAFAPLAKEDTQEPVPYDVEEVAFESGDVTLAGTLTLPPTEGPHPVVVLVSGSGPQDRDESLGADIAIKPFHLLADALTREGIAVLRYDDRGVGKSTGTFADAILDDFTADAGAAIQYLLTRDDVDPDQIGLVGHSEGGLVAAMLGARNDELDFIIAMAGPAVSGRDVLLLQNQRVMAAEGATAEEINAQLTFVESLFDVIDDPEAIETLTYEYTLTRLEALTEEQRATIGDLEQYARTIAAQTAQQYSTGWFVSFLNYDPALDWAQTTVPVLAFFGGNDVQVDAEQNAPALEAALEEAGNEDYEIVVLPKANHLFQEADTGGVSEYATLPAEFTPEFLPTLITWLQDHVVINE